ncbi:MAG: hypothetical protein JST89_08975 [Cyanobacteria bacterium SZAS-4]|nr:hypothetical protein [Cyanobacteria bacterium SZAS-4]
MHSVNKTIVATIVAALTLQLGASAQQWGQKKSAPPLTVKALSGPQLMPDVPQYTGQARFISGEKSDRNDGDSIRQTWHIREGRAEAVNWYKTALSGAGWKISAASRGTITGTRSDGTIMVIVNEIPLPDHYKSELMIQYYKSPQK